MVCGCRSPCPGDKRPRERQRPPGGPRTPPACPSDRSRTATCLAANPASQSRFRRFGRHRRRVGHERLPPTSNSARCPHRDRRPRPDGRARSGAGRPRGGGLAHGPQTWRRRGRPRGTRGQVTGRRDVTWRADHRGSARRPGALDGGTWSATSESRLPGGVTVAVSTSTAASLATTDPPSGPSGPSDLTFGLVLRAPTA